MNLPRFIRQLPRPTQLGFSLIQFAAVLIIASSLLRNETLLFMAALTAALILLCFVRCAINLHGLEVSRSLPYPLYAGSRFSTTVFLRNSSRVLPSVLVCVYDHVKGAGCPRRPLFGAIALIAPGRQIKSVQHGTFYRRGYKRFERIELESTYPLDLFRSVRTIEREETVLVFPRIRRLALQFLSDRLRHAWERPVAVRAMHGVDEFAGLREYRPGDNPKWIHWKSIARADRKLLVKELELSTMKRVRLVLETAVPKRLLVRSLLFERAVEFTASIARELAANHYVTYVHIRGRKDRIFKVNPHDQSLLVLFHELALVEPVRKGTELPAVPSDMPAMYLDPVMFEPNRPWEQAISIKNERRLW